MSTDTASSDEQGIDAPASRRGSRLNKLLLGLVTSIVVVVAVFFGVARFLPSTWRCQRELLINAPPEQIYLLVSDLKRWPDWTVWNQEVHPTLNFTYEGSNAGAGAVQVWTAEQIGRGRLEITSADPRAGIDYGMGFEGFDGVMHGQIRFDLAGDATKVVWSGAGDLGNSALFRWMSAIFDWEEMVGNDYEQGLAKLKTMIESRT